MTTRQGMTTRRAFLKTTTAALSGLAATPMFCHAAGSDLLGYEFDHSIAGKRFNEKDSWSHARTGICHGALPDGGPRAVMTVTTIENVGWDVYKGVYTITSDDGGETWSEAEYSEGLAPRSLIMGNVEYPIAVADMTPGWHAKTKSVLNTGHTVLYNPGWKNPVTKREIRVRGTVYSGYDSENNTWAPWDTLNIPHTPHPKGVRTVRAYLNRQPGDPEPEYCWPFYYEGAGSCQRYDEKDGTILLPTYFVPRWKESSAMVMRCSWDGKKLEFIEHGDEIEVKNPKERARGMHEPSITKFGDRYFLTLRNDIRGYVARSNDGLHYGSYQPWCFDDGEELGNYNTQQHWISHSDGLFLCYTRRGLNNDHVFRHRAPLLMAQVDPDRLCVIRETEKAIVPNRGARLGNFGTTHFSPRQSWVTNAEWMHNQSCAKYGSDGSIFVTRIQWEKENKDFEV